MDIQIRKVYRSATLVGTPVRNPRDEDLGKIEEIVIDMDAGNVAYLVLSFGGILGMGGKLFAVPWDQVLLKYAPGGMCFVLDVDREKLRNAPGFDKNNWPDMSHPDWAAQIEAHYRRGKEPKKSERERETVKAGPV